MSDPLSSLTILLALKDRVPFTHRWLSYAASAKLTGSILVADGGADSDVADAVAARRADGLNVEYRRYPFDESYAHYYRKLADALSRVTTPFVVLADNDDFFIKDGLIRAVEFLHTHPDHVACGGQCAVFWLGAERQADQDSVYGRTVEWKCSSQMHSDVAETARQRILDQTLGASDVFYAVHRTELLRQQFEAVRDFNPHDLFLMEQLVAFLTATSGKCRQLDLLYIARQQDSPGSSGGGHQEQFGNWFDRMLLPTWSGDFTRFVDLAASALARADGISVEDARRIIVDCYKMSIAPSLLSNLLDEPTVTSTMPVMLQVVRRLVHLPPTSLLRRVAQQLYRRTRWISHDLVHGTEFHTAQSRNAAAAFAPIRTFLTAKRDHSSVTRGT